MCRYTGPKNRVARRFGANIFGKARNPLMRKPNPPGMHGARRRKKSDYGLQLEEKQKLKAVYGMLMEKQLVNTFKKADHKKGPTAQLFLEAIECRLDNIVYRLGLAKSIFAAQQLVNHGHILVDGKKMAHRSFRVMPGMTVSVKEKSRTVKAISETVQAFSGNVPSYLILDKATFSGRLESMPLQEEIEQQLPLPINVGVVCEFLAHTT